VSLVIPVLAGVYYLFLFQAEDGIRDFHVTGVQTCALPIWRTVEMRNRAWWLTRSVKSHLANARYRAMNLGSRGHFIGEDKKSVRSEERRVGKEDKAGWGRCSQNERRNRRCEDADCASTAAA